MSELFPEIDRAAKKEVKSSLFPELNQIAPKEETLPEITPSKEAYHAGLDAFLGGDEKAALSAWSKSQEPEAHMGIERIMHKRAPLPVANPTSMDAYKKGLEAFLTNDYKKADSLWAVAEQDPNNIAAKMGRMRLSRMMNQEKGSLK